MGKKQKIKRLQAEYAEKYRAHKTRSAIMLAVGLFATSLTVDRSLGELMWHGAETNVSILSEHEEYYTDDIMFVLPGLGVQSGEGIASVLKSSFESSSTIAYAQYSDDGVDLGVLTADIEQQLSERNAKTVSFYAHSMGGSILMQILPEIAKKYPINNIILDCSPFTIYDAKNSFAPVSASVIPAYGGGLLTKFGFEIVNNTITHKNNSLSIAEQLKDAYRVTVTGSSPRLWTNQFGLLGKTNPYNFRISETKKANIYYIMPDNPDNDETVYTNYAFKAWDDYYGGRVRLITVFGGGHANETDRPSEYKQALAPYFEMPLVESHIYQIHHPKK